MKIDDRFERIAILGKQNRRNLTEYSVYDSPAYYDTLQQFNDWTEPAMRPGGLKGDDVVGAWRGISMFGGEIKAGYAIFFSNGQAFFASSFPVRGCDRIDTWLEAELISRNWGTYTLEDGKGRMKMSYGEIPLRLTPAALVLTTNKTEHRFVRLPSVDDARFEGRYVRPEHNGKVPSIVFTPDGKFGDDGALDVLNPQLNYPFKITAQPGSGSYAVKDYTIALDYNDGRRFRIAFPGEGYDKTNPSPATLTPGFSEQVLQRK
jgi:hypothetical protein